MWMFGGISLLMLLGGTARVRNLAPGMAGALSHAGITGACTAGEMGEIARNRAPIMIAVPFLGHVFLFTILALSVDTGGCCCGRRRSGEAGARAGARCIQDPRERRLLGRDVDAGDDDPWSDDET
jgi:hypothetical protein